MEVVVARPDRVDCGERHVLVHPPISGDDVVQRTDERVKVDQERLSCVHEVGIKLLCDRRIDDAILHQSGIELLERLAETSAAEERIVLPVLKDQFSKSWQQAEVGARGIRSTDREVGSDTARAVRLPEENTHEVI